MGDGPGLMRVVVRVGSPGGEPCSAACSSARTSGSTGQVEWSCKVRGRCGDDDGIGRWFDGGHGWLRSTGWRLTSGSDVSAAVTMRMAWIDPVPNSAEKFRAALGCWPTVIRMGVGGGGASGGGVACSCAGTCSTAPAASGAGRLSPLPPLPPLPPPLPPPFPPPFPFPARVAHGFAGHSRSKCSPLPHSGLSGWFLHLRCLSLSHFDFTGG